MDAEPGPGPVPVWDPLVRIVHWGVAAGVLIDAALLDAESAAHRQIGYAVLALVLLRLFWGLIGPAPARFSAFPPSVSGALAHVGAMLSGAARPHLSHNPVGAWMIYALWATLLGVALTGVLMTTDRSWGVEALEEAHEALANLLLALAALHVLGVAVEQRRSRVDLVRAMVTGVKTFPARPDPRPEGGGPA
jgi:cytochrome b